MSGETRSSGAHWSRGRADLVIIGRRAILEALEEPQVEVSEIRISRRSPADVRKHFRKLCREQGVEFEECDDSRIRELSREPRFDQGIAARIRLRGIMDVDGFLDSLKGERAKHPTHVLAMDGITNPQNIGMIVRSVVASGLDGLLWPTVGTPWIDGLVVKSSAGMVFRCPVIRCETMAQAVTEFQGAGFKVGGLVMGGSQSLFDFEPDHRQVFIVGGETMGLAPGVDEILDQRIRIPMQRDVESLNVAIASALCCFEMMRRRQDR